jgi:hypothetical protein
MNSATGILSPHGSTFTAFNNPMYIVSKGIDTNTAVRGFQLQSNAWRNMPVTDFYSGKAITSRVPGTFIFAGRAVNIPGIETVRQGGAISAFTAKHGLNDFLGNDLIDMNRNATRQMVAGCVSRMAGAPRGSDPINWVSTNLNMALSSRNANGAVQLQEAVAMVMALYENKTNTRISTMTIRNHTLTANMTGLDNRYAQAMRAAFEIGVLTDVNIRPRDNITIGGLLNMLAALDAKIGL